MNDNRPQGQSFGFIDWAFEHPWIALLIIGSVIGLLINAADGDLSNGRGPITSRGICEELWAENRATAESPYMTKERYISNCMETNRDLMDGRLDGR